MLEKTAGTVRYCYNWGLAIWNDMHSRGELCDKYFLSRKWTAERPEWAKETNRASQTQALMNLGAAFSRFFKKKVKHPQFHKKGRRDSFYVNNTHAWLSPGQRVHIPGAGNVKLAEPFRYSGNKIESFTVYKRCGLWFVVIATNLPENPSDSRRKGAVGIDVGIKHWACTSDGEVFDAPKRIAKLRKRLRLAQRRSSKKKLGSKNRQKANQRCARIAGKISNTKIDAVHKFTTTIAKSHGLVCCETLDVLSLMRSKRKGVRRGAQEGCMSLLRKQLAYKAKHYIEIPRFFPSSKICSSCGHVLEHLDLDARVYRCPSCGFTANRDINAAINIRNEGLRIFTEGHSG